MPFNNESLAEARKQGYSDEQIFQHLSESDDRFITAQKNGYSLDDIASHLTKKGGVIPNEVNKQSQPEANTDSNEQLQGNKQIQSANEAGLQPSEVQLPESKGQEQLIGNVNPDLSINAQFQTGGENRAETEQTTEGSQRKKAGEGLRGQVPSGNQAQVGAEAGVPSPSSKVPWYKNIPLSATAQAEFSAIETASGFERAGSAPITDVSGVNAPFQRGAKVSEVTSAFDKAIADKQSALKSIEDIVEKQGFSAAEYSGQISDLQRDISSLKAQKEETLKLPQYSEESQKTLQSERKELAKDATELSKTAESVFPALGVSKEDKSFPAQLGRGVGQVVALAPAMLAGPLSLPVMVVQGGSQAYAEGYNGAVEQLKKSGVTDQAIIDVEAHKIGSKAAVKTVPSLAAYTIGGSLTTRVMAAFLKGTSPLVAGGAGGAAAAFVNSAVSAGLRVSEGGDLLPNVEQAVPDLLFGGLHSFGDYSNAQAEVIKANLSKVGLPETAKVVEKENPPTIFEVDPSEEVESIYKTAQEAIASGDRTGASMSLNAAKEAEASPENATTPEQQAERNKRWTSLDALIEKMPTEQVTGEPSKPISEQTTQETTKINEEQVQETSGVSTEQGKPIVETTAIQTEEGTTQRQGEGKKEVVNAPTQYLPGASSSLELYNKDVQLGTQIIQGKKGVSYDAWKGLLESRLYEGKYTEEELLELYNRSKEVAKIADTGVPVAEAVKQIGKAPLDPKSKNSLMNSALNAVRQSMGLSRLGDLARQGQEALFDRVMYMLDDDPYYSSRVISKAKNNPNEPLSPEDRVVLLNELIAVRTKYDNVLKAIAEEENPENQQMMKDQLKQLQDQYQELSDVSRLTIRSTAQALNLQRAFVRDDFSNLGMLRKLSADVVDRPEKFGGNKPTQAEIEKINQQSERILALEKELSERVEKAKTESMDEDLEIFTKEAQSESKKTDPIVQRILDVIAEKLGTQAQSARERIQQRRKEGRLNVGLDPTDLADHAIIGADYIVKGTGELAEWSVKMINEFGDYIKPYLDQIFKAANEQIDNEIGVAVETSKEKRISKKELKNKVAAEAKRSADQSPDGKIQRAINLIRENLGDDEVIGSIVRGLAKAVHAKAYRSGNMLNRNQFADAVHKIVSREIEGWSEVNTKEAMVGYGIFKQLTKEAEAVRLRELNGEIRELSKQTDIREGNAPKKSGSERPPKGTIERIEVKKTKALLKKFGITTKDPATQLAGAMDSIKNRLRNHIEELTERITTGERAPKKQPIAYDEEATALKAERDALQEQFDVLYGKTERTMEEKIAAYEISNQRLIEAKQKAIAAERDRIAAGKKYTPKQKEKLTSPKLEEQKEQLAQLSDEAQLVRDSDYLRKEENKQVSIANRLRAIEEEILGIAKKKEKEQGPVSGPVAFLEGKLKEAEAKLKVFRDSKKVKKTEDEQILQKLNNQKTAAEEKLARLQNEQKKATGKKSMVLNEEQRKVQNEIDDLNKQSKDYQEASKKRTTQEERNIKSWERRIKLLEKQREARGVKPPKKPAEPMTARELALQKAHAELKAEIKQDDWYLENRGKLAIEAYRNQLIKRKESFIRRSAEKDFAPKVRVEKAFDPVAEKLKAEVERVKNEFEEDRKLAQYQSRSKFEKAMMQTVAWKRTAVLFYVSTLAKLGVASVEIPLFKIPLNAAGMVLRQIPAYKQIAKLAPSEGGGKVAEDIKAFVNGFYTGASEAFDIAIKQKESSLTLLNREETGGAASKMPKNRFFDAPQKFHEAIKNSTKQGVYRLSLQRWLNFQRNRGIEIYGPEGEAARLQASIGAFKDAENSIFLGNNALVKFYNSIVQQAVNNKNVGVRGLGYTMQEFIPIVRIPLNIVQFTVESQVGLPLSFARILAARIHGGLENISPEQANGIMRQAKAGSVGLMMLAIGASNPSYFGGLHREGKKPDEDELQFGEAMIMGIKIPKQFMHIPLLNCLQIGATARQIVDERIEDAEGLGEKSEVIAMAILEAEMAFVKDVPFINVANEVSQYFKINRVGPTLGALVRSNIPGFIQETARWIDRDEDGKKIKRESKTFIDVVSQGLPFVRETVTPKE
jgi:hypothetical protein